MSQGKRPGKDGAGAQQWQRRESSVFTKSPSFTSVGCGARWCPEPLSSGAEVHMHMGHLDAGTWGVTSQGLGLHQCLCRAEQG